jgi:hypothetical protein
LPQAGIDTAPLALNRGRNTFGAHAVAGALADNN